MAKIRSNNAYSSLQEIIEALSKNPHTSSVWVGENYSKQDLIDDLIRLNETTIPKFYGGVPSYGMSEFPTLAYPETIKFAINPKLEFITQKKIDEEENKSEWDNYDPPKDW